MKKRSLKQLVGILFGLVFGIIVAFMEPKYNDHRFKALNYYELQEAIHYYNTSKERNILSADDIRKLQDLLPKIQSQDFVNVWKDIEKFYEILNKNVKNAHFTFHHNPKTNNIKWFEQNWLLVLFLILTPMFVGWLLGYFLQLKTTIEEKIRTTVENQIKGISQTAAETAAKKVTFKCPAYSSPPKLRLSVDAILPNELADKIHSPIQVLIDKEITGVLTNFLQTVHREDLSTHTGMVWVMPEADVKTYGTLAQALDDAMLKTVSGTIYSTNLVPPNDFSEEAVKKHLDKVNKLLGKIDETPRVLRIQIVKLEDSKVLDLLGKEEFLTHLKEKKWGEYVEHYLKENSIFLIDSKAEIAKPKNILGDYILYGDSLVLKWDDKVSSLYLMFGTELIEAHKRIFADLLKNYHVYIGQTNVNKSVIDLYTWAKENGVV